MKRIIFIVIVLMLSVSGFAQADTTKPNEPDTIKVGNFIIIKKDKKTNTYDTVKKSNEQVLIDIGSSETSSSHHRYHNRIISTNWLIFDLGFANWRDKTNYGSAEANAYLIPYNGHSFTSNDLDLKNVKSTNVNLWFFMQKLSVVKNVFNLKYGLGLQMYNYRYETNISYKKSPPSIEMDTIDFSKNKLAADYVTIPFMININPYPRRREGFSFSVGISAGYLYSSRNKQISDERGKQKTKGDFGLDPWRFAYVGEIGLGPVRVYGSYSINNLYEHGVKQYPYAIGLRFSNW